MITSNLNMQFLNRRKQKGATLPTTLVFLMLMTLVSVSATKISILDTLVAGNDQTKMILSQQTENCLRVSTHIRRLFIPLTNNGVGQSQGFVGNVGGRADQYKFDQLLDACQDGNVNIEEYITDIPGHYNCEREGQASSMGPAVPRCDLFDFQIRSNKPNSGARDIHHRGAGKMVPNTGSKGSLI